MASLDVNADEALIEALKSVRNDATPLKWAIAAHPDNDPNNLVLAASGDGDVDEMVSHFDAGLAMHALIRVTQTIDLSVTTKFVYVYFVGEEVPFVKRGKFGVVFGKARTFFQPYHVDFEINKQSELDQAIVDRKIAQTSGKVDNVSDAIGDRQERGFTASAGTKKTGAVRSAFGWQGNASAVSANAGIQFDQEVLDAIRDVHHDVAKWCLAVYQDDDLKKPVVLKGRGTGSVDAEMLPLLQPNSLAYGLVRVVDVIDNISTAKFAYVFFLGPEVKMMTKAKVGTHKGSIQEKFAPYHVDFDISSTREISDALVLQKVQAASGSRSMVR